MLRKFWRPILWRWHRRLGLTLILLLLWLSVTGLFLNHTDDLELAERPLGYAYLLQLYGIDSLPVTSFASANETVFSQAGDHLYLQSSRLTQCRTDQFSFLVVDSSWLLAACGVELVMLTPQGERLFFHRCGYVNLAGCCAGKIYCCSANTNTSRY